MDNDPVNKSNEEEYQFVDSEHPAEFGSMSAKSSSMPTRQDTSDARKKIFIAVGIIVAAFCLYKLYGVFSEAPVKPKAEMPAVVAAPKPLAAPQPPPVPTETQEVSSMQNKVGTLEKVVSQVSQSNANLQDQMAGVATSIADLQSSISSLTQQISDLAKAKEKPVEEAKKPEEKKVVIKKKVKAVSVASTNYYVKAMIQGRAWLMTSAGATLTVSEGDSLPGYGEIRNIDTEKGEVVTSSGSVIKYRTGDR